MRSIYMKLLFVSILLTSVNAVEKTADDLIKSMKKADITYAQLMAGMSQALNNIQSGIIGMNSVLVDEGIDFIRTHPSPKQKPWVIMAKEDRESFKSTLLYFDKKMDEDVEVIERAVKQKDWNSALMGLSTFENTCMSCHNSWKNKVKYIME